MTINRDTEKWTVLKHDKVLKDRYLISTNGRIYDKVDKKHMTEYHETCRHDHLEITLKNFKGVGTRFKIVALMIYTFKNSKYHKGGTYTYTYINGNKDDLYIGNLDMITRLKKTLTIDHIHRICWLVEKNISDMDIITLFNNEYHEKNIRYTINHIKNGTGYRHISRNYQI